MAAIFGLTFLLITPPFQGADETTHFLRAYQVSKPDFMSDKQGTDVGGVLPVSIGQAIDAVHPDAVTFYPALKYDGHRTRIALGVDNTPKEKFYSFPGTASYSPVAYLGAAPGIAVSRLLRLPSIVALYAGRLGNLLLWIGMLAWAIALIPRRKWVLVFLGLLPMALFQAATINGDAVTFGSLALLLAMVLNFREQKKLSNKQLLLLVSVATIMVLGKQVMILFLPLFLLLKKESFAVKGKRTHLLIKFGLMVLPFLIYCAWVLLSKDVGGGGPYTHGEDPSKQLSFVMHNPHSFLNVLWNTYFFTWGDGITRSLIGSFGWNDAPLSELIVSIGYAGGALLAFSTYRKSDDLALSRYEKFLIAAMAALYLVGVSASLYLFYSPVAYKIVYGLQGRYFIPMLALLLPFVASKKIKLDQDLYLKVAVALPTFLLIASTITIYVRYYIHNV